ncbi:MAG: hypothetical protein MPJ05_04745 [Nitrosopumilus sp.]|nr:hypothetical protein [Nitrosopumilus sp.]
MRSTDKAEFLLHNDPADFEPRTNAESEGSLRDLCAWLETVRYRAISDSVFDNTILSTIRLVAEYILAIRQMKKHTTSITGWVFQKTIWEDVSRVKQTALSMIVPELESCMSIRIPDDLTMVEKNTYTFKNVYPVPLTNRLHSSRSEFEPAFVKHKLRDWNFLKTAFCDHDEFSDSIEMDNYCEIKSAQSENDSRLQLGAPLILVGSAVSVDHGTVMIKDNTGSKTIKTIYSGLDPITEGDLHGLIGKPARFLIIKWYQPSEYVTDHEKDPELVHFELSESESELVVDDMIGYVRLRRNVPMKEISSTYGAVDMSADCLAKRQDAVEFISGYSGTESLLKQFFDTTEKIRKMWPSYGTEGRLLATGRSILSQKKINEAAILNRLKKRPELGELLLEIQKIFDNTGGWPDMSEYDGSNKKYSIRSLRLMDLLDQDHRDPTVTKLGRKMLMSQLSDMMQQYADSSDVIYMPDLDERFPRSIMSEYLVGRSDFDNLEDKSSKNKLIWIKNRNVMPDIIDNYKTRLSGHQDLILETIRTRNSDINPRLVHTDLARKGFQLDYFSIRILLEMIAYTGKLSRRGDSLDAGGYWRYDMYWRIKDVVETDRDGEWSLDRILDESKAPRMSTDEIMKIMKKLENEGILIELADRMWIFKKEGSDPIKTNAMAFAKEHILITLRSKKPGVDSQMLEDRISRMLHDRFGARLSSRRVIVKNAILNLEESGEIRTVDRICKIIPRD